MDIESLDQLNQVELKIKKELRKRKLGDILHSLYLLRHKSSSLEPFMVAGTALFAIRFCSPSKPSQNINNYDIRGLVDLSTNYYLADPVTFDSDLRDEFKKSNPVFMLLRYVSSQFPFYVKPFSEFARPALLFDQIPRKLKGSSDVPNFDFEEKFKAVTGSSVIDFITTGFVIYAQLKEHFSINQVSFKKTRKQGINLPDDQTVKLILKQIATDKNTLVDLYKKRQNKDRRFKMYDFNPLLYYPVIKPCQDKQFSTEDKDFIHAPVPELVASRICNGIFYQMFNEYGEEFSTYFGHIFEKYVGYLLENCLLSEELLSESNIRQFYPIDKGKCPDWIMIDDSTTILFECKATRFSRAAQATASEDAVNKSLAQVIKGIKQLASFISACQNQLPELQKFHGSDQFCGILVSLEPLHLINSGWFRDHISQLLINEGIREFNWQIISIDELEALEPHISSGIKLSKVLNDLSHRKFNDVLEDLIEETNNSFTHSCLYPMQQKLYQRLGL